MTLSLYLSVAGRSPQRHATLPTHQTVPSTTPVLPSTVPYYSVLQSATPVLPCYKVLLQYYTGLLQYYSVLQSTSPVLNRTTPVLLCITKYYCVLKSLTWNFTDIARSNRRRCPTSPNTVPATKVECDRIVRPNNPAASQADKCRPLNFFPR